MKGATSPLYGYGIRSARRAEVIGKLFQSTAVELCERYAQRLRVCVYAHDADVLRTYIMSAFAMDVADVARDVKDPIAVIGRENGVKFTFKELGKRELTAYRDEIIGLYRGLINHLRRSPIFYHCRYFLPLEERFDDFLTEDMRIFAAFDEGKLIGMIDSEPAGEGIQTFGGKSMGMGDVFVVPSYRGLGVAHALLEYANHELKSSGIQRLYVMHGTINPTARGFWDKFFTPYAYTMTRSIDPAMLGPIEPV